MRDPKQPEMLGEQRPLPRLSGWGEDRRPGMGECWGAGVSLTPWRHVFAHLPPRRWRDPWVRAVGQEGASSIHCLLSPRTLRGTAGSLGNGSGEPSFWLCPRQGALKAVPCPCPYRATRTSSPACVSARTGAGLPRRTGGQGASSSSGTPSQGRPGTILLSLSFPLFFFSSQFGQQCRHLVLLLVLQGQPHEADLR